MKFRNDDATERKVENTKASCTNFIRRHLVQLKSNQSAEIFLATLGYKSISNTILKTAFQKREMGNTLPPIDRRERHSPSHKIFNEEEIRGNVSSLCAPLPEATRTKQTIPSEGN